MYRTRGQTTNPISNGSIKDLQNLLQLPVQLKYPYLGSPRVFKAT